MHLRASRPPSLEAARRQMLSKNIRSTASACPAGIDFASLFDRSLAPPAARGRYEARLLIKAPSKPAPNRELPGRGPVPTSQGGQGGP